MIGRTPRHLWHEYGILSTISFAYRYKYFSVRSKLHERSLWQSLFFSHFGWCRMQWLWIVNTFVWYSLLPRAALLCRGQSSLLCNAVMCHDGITWHGVSSSACPIIRVNIAPSAWADHPHVPHVKVRVSCRHDCPLRTQEPLIRSLSLPSRH